MQGSIEAKDRETRLHPRQDLLIILRLFARGQEYNSLLSSVTLQEAPESVDLVLHLADNVGLRQGVWSGDLAVLMHGHHDRLVQGEPGKVLDTPGLGGGEEQRLPLRGEGRDNRVDRLSETQVQAPVGLVQHQHLQVVEVEVGVLIEVLQQSARGADEDVTPTNPAPLELEVFASDHQAGAEVVGTSDFAQGLEDLVSKLPAQVLF